MRCFGVLMRRPLDDLLNPSEGDFNGVAIVIAHRLTTIKESDKIIVMGSPSTKSVCFCVRRGGRRRVKDAPSPWQPAARRVSDVVTT